MIRVLLAEDQALLRGALVNLLNLESDIDVVGAAENGALALKLASSCNPDIVLTDIEMPELSGLDLAAKLKAAEHPAKVMVVTTFARAGFLRRALALGVRGYLLKEMPVEKLAEAIRTVHSGAKVIAPELALEAWKEEDDPLSERERAVLQLAGEGMASAEIAERLHLSNGTVRNYLSEAIGKLGSANRIEAYRLAKQRGWL